MIVLVRSGGEAAVPEWREALRTADPRLEVRWWDDPDVAPEAVRYVVVWEPEPGRLAALPGLRAVFSAAAGVEHITRDPDWPRHLPLVRMGGGETEQRMAEYACWACLHLLRGGREMALAQAEGCWRSIATPRTARETRVGVLGQGNLGLAAARALRGLGFAVAGWSRTPKREPGVESFHGAEGLEPMLARSDLLLCLLPATPETEGLLDAARLALLPAGAGVVNCGRGSQLALPALLAALDAGHLSGAVLDVFPEEPLPAGDPLWRHPRVTVTPHVASMASRRDRARYVAAAIAAQERGEPLPNLFDPGRGY